MMMSSIMCYYHLNISFTKFLVIVLLAAAASLHSCYAQDGTGYICTRATYYGSPDCIGSPRGACGFGEYGRTANNGEVSGVSRLYRNGSGCGACYQVRCKIPTHCTDEGTKVMVTDFGVGHETDFILSLRAYANLARPNLADELYGFGVIDVEYRRIACGYVNNLMIKIHEHSKFPSYLAILPAYQPGTYDITDVQIWLEDCKEWRGMRKVYGAVWDMENPPIGMSLNMRFQFQVSDDVKWVQIANAIPTDWKPGVAYDNALQL